MVPGALIQISLPVVIVQGAVGHGGRLSRALNNVGVVFQANIGDYAFLVGEPFGHLLGNSWGVMMPKISFRRSGKNDVRITSEDEETGMLTAAPATVPSIAANWTRAIGALWWSCGGN